MASRPEDPQRPVLVHTPIGDPSVINPGDIMSSEDPYLARWNAVYDFVEEIAGHKKEAGSQIGAVLDVGVHDGFAISKLLRIAPKAVGIDIDPDKITHARQRPELQAALQDGSAQVLLMDAHFLQFPDELFDIVTMADVLRTRGQKDIVRMLQEVKRVMSDGATAVITFKGRAFDELVHYAISNDPATVDTILGTEGDPQQVRRVVDSTFQNVKWYGQTPVVGESKRNFMFWRRHRGANVAQQLSPVKIERERDFDNYMFLIAVAEKEQEKSQVPSRAKRLRYALSQQASRLSFPGRVSSSPHSLQRSNLGMATQLVRTVFAPKAVDWLRGKARESRSEPMEDPIRLQVTLPAYRELSAEGLFDGRPLMLLGVTDGLDVSRIIDPDRPESLPSQVIGVDTKEWKLKLLRERFEPGEYADPILVEAGVSVHTVPGDIEWTMTRFLNFTGGEHFNGIARIDLPISGYKQDPSIKDGDHETFAQRMNRLGLRLVANTLQLLRHCSTEQAKVILVETGFIPDEEYLGSDGQIGLYEGTGWRRERVVHADIIPFKTNLTLKQLEGCIPGDTKGLIYDELGSPISLTDALTMIRQAEGAKVQPPKFFHEARVVLLSPM